jgi:hypothetical protein
MDDVSEKRDKLNTVRTSKNNQCLGFGYSIKDFTGWQDLMRPAVLKGFVG